MLENLKYMGKLRDMKRRNKDAGRFVKRGDEYDTDRELWQVIEELPPMGCTRHGDYGECTHAARIFIGFV